MNGSDAGLLNGIMLAFVLGMLLFPLVFVLFVPTKIQETEALDRARRRQLVLGLLTLLAIAVWGGLALLAKETGSTLFDQFARQMWLLFFPLWFAVAMPAVLAKNPAWGGSLKGTCASDSPIRTASLIPRARDNPIRSWQWVLMGVMMAGALAAIASRGAYSFSTQSLSPDSAKFRWALLTVIYTALLLMTALIVPWSISRTQLEPEPLDPRGTKALQAMYRADRCARSRIIFWLHGVIQPLTIGWIFAVIVWNPVANGRTMAYIGATLGTIGGLAGAGFGIASAIRRMRINAAKARLEAAAGSPYVSKSGNP